MTLAARAALGAFAAGLVGLWAAFPVSPNPDTLYALVWARELLDGAAPSFDAYRAPTQHPLLLAVGIALAPLGDAADRAVVLLAIGGLVALVAAVWRLGLRAGGVLCAALAALLIASRLNLGLLALIGFLDLPYLALVTWAVVLEVERPRRGGAVWVLLALAGLLRPEAWLLGGLYALWVRRPSGFAAAAVAPLTWAAVDLAVTGDPLFSLHHTDALALELARQQRLASLPWTGVELLEEAVKWPVLAAGAAGAALAIARRRRDLAVLLAVVPVTYGTWLVIATGGLATVYRYLLLAAVALTALAAYALTAPRGRWAWAAGALVVAGAAWTALHTSPAKARAELRERSAIRADLRALLADPRVAAAARCGSVSVPNHKLLAEVRWALDRDDRGVVARSAGLQRRGVAILIERAIEDRPALAVREVGRDGIAITWAPAGFAPVAANRRFAAWGRC